MNWTVPAQPQRNWEDLFEAVVADTDTDDFPARIQEAQDAVMDEIEDSFSTASPSKRQALISAMNALRELRRMSENAPHLRVPGSEPPGAAFTKSPSSTKSAGFTKGSSAA